MKELSIEEKAKAYDKALEKARLVLQERGNEPDGASILSELFSELTESEDERIRRRIIHALHGDVLEMSEIKEAIAWLEKQGEHAKFCDSIQVGDKVTRNQDGVLVNLSQLNRVAKKDEKQGEQKPADKVEPFDKFEGLTDFERTLADICIGWIGEEYGWEQYIKDNADVLLKIAIKKFNSIQDAPFEQKPTEWSEEDEKHLNRAINILDISKAYTTSPDKYEDTINWLKSLKDRCIPQLKQEWSEENENVLEDIEEAIINYWHGDTQYILLDWLKSLRPQSQWKPSEEQIKALGMAINSVPTLKGVLQELLEQLKAL